MNKVSLAEKCGLLHDNGKVCIRATREKKKHSVLGKEFMEQFLTGTEDDKQLLRCISYHHGKELSKAKLPNDDLAYLIYEADNISAGMDRRTYEEETEFGFEADACLENIFNVFSGEGQPSYFPLKELNAERESVYPVSVKNFASSGRYNSIMQYLSDNFKKKSPMEMTNNELLRILEDTMIYIPSSTNVSEYGDISLYDHAKLTGAVAGVMVKYFDANNITDYKDSCFVNSKDYRSKDMFLMISGDFSGIQKFIYKTQSKGAMRMLRGKSFYLDMALENIVDDLLEELELSRANLIYCSGGHFYILADNTDKTRQSVIKARSKINRDLLHIFSGSLYLSLAYTPFCPNDLMSGTESGRNIFRDISDELSLVKQKRYDKEVLADLFNENSTINQVNPGERECPLCHNSREELSPYSASAYDEIDDNYSEFEVCDICNGLYDLGKSILDDRKTIFGVVKEKPDEDTAVPLPSLYENLWLVAGDKTLFERLQKEEKLVRIYDKNGSNTSSLMAARLWVADYAAKNKDNQIMNFNELAENSGGEKGIKRLGVLRADVDNLGAAFIAGFQRKNEKNPNEYATLSRYTTLSRSLAQFFKKTITGICKKELPAGISPFYLFEEKEGKPRNIHIIYSGGDDLFLVGAWDDLIEFAVDLKRTFSVYTNGKLTFSAGLGLYSSHYPISRMADVTGELEDIAKKNPGKDSIAFFGSDTEYDYHGEKESAPVYHWDEFINTVHGDKMKFLNDHLVLFGINDKDKSKTRIPAGKSLLYRIMELLKGSKDNKMDLARFAYTLARLKPRDDNLEKCYEEVKTTFYKWAMNDKERRELVTALQFIIYRMRDKEEA